MVNGERNIRHAVLFACGALVCGGPVAAAVTEAEYFDELPVVLSVSRMSQPLNEAPAAVTVIDQEMIRASGFRDIPDLLRLVPGFSVAYTRDNTWGVGYHGLADAFSRRMQVLVDGRSIYSAAFGAVQWQELPLAIDDIERIEVVRGPNAATYGANAFLAVINIISKEAAQVQGGFASLQYGEQGMAGLTLRHGGADGDLAYRLTFSAQNRDRFETDALIRRPPVPVKLFEETRTYLVNGRADYRVSARDDISAQFGLAIGDWQSGRMFPLNPLDPELLLEPRQQDIRNGYVQLKFRRVESADREWMVQFYHSRHKVDASATLTLPGLIVNGDQDALQTRTNLEFQANNRLADTLRMAWGGEVRRDAVESSLYFNGDDTHDGVLGRVYANLEWQARPDLLLHGGAMLEHHYDTGFDISPRIALNYTFAPEHTLRLSASQAYRTPTFLEAEGNYVYDTTLGVPLDVISIPAADLEPERIRSYEIGYVGQFKPWQLQVDARLFHDRVDDYIDGYRVTLPVGAELVALPPFAPPGTLGRARQLANSGSIEFTGYELQLNWRPTPAVRMTAQYARVFISPSPETDAADDDIRDSSSRDNFSLLASYQFGDGWMVSSGVYASGAMTWLGDGDPVPAFTRVDARVARRWTWQGREVEAALVGQSLFDDYSEFRTENVFSPRVYGSLSLAW